MQLRGLIGGGLLLLLLTLLPSTALPQERGQGYLGIRPRPLTEAERKSLDLPTGGVFVAGIIKDGPAEKGGLQENDVLLQCNGKSLSSSEELQAVVKGIPPKSPAAFVLLRGKERKEIVCRLT